MSSRYNSLTSQKDVEPGDRTGEYYITFCNLAFHSTWQEIKDWLSTRCTVDFVEVFPTSCSGWIRLKGKVNFEKALAHMGSERFKDRLLLVDGRNETESVKIKIKQTSPKPNHSNGSRSSTGGNRGQRVPSRQIQSPDQPSTPQPRRTRSLTRGENDVVDATDVAARQAYDDFFALANCMLSMSLQSALQMQYYALPSSFSYYEGGYYNNMDCYNGCTCYYGGDPVLCYGQEEVPLALPGNAGDDIQSWVDDDDDKTERRAQSEPPF